LSAPSAASPAGLRGSPELDELVREGLFGRPEARPAAWSRVRRAAEASGLRSSSLQGLYQAVAAGRSGGFTVPAFNLRGLIYPQARSLFRAAKALGAGAFIFEISRGEMSYTDVRPSEFSGSVLAAALREEWRGPVFIQGDHFQFNSPEYARDPRAETSALKTLTQEALDAGFRNIDIDASTLVRLDRPTLREQQRDNYERTAELTSFIRDREEPGFPVSVGGEIGEVGQKNSTVEEFEAFFEGYREAWTGVPISKMSVQTGTAHGGVVRADGSRAPVEVDFAVLRQISAACRKRGLGGAVQHGASTLPDEMLGLFPKNDTLEIHLATGFQQTIFNHPEFPRELREDMARWVETHRPPEWKAEASTAQNFEKSVKRTWGPFKKRLGEIPEARLGRILETLEARHRMTLEKLGVRGTGRLVLETLPSGGP
jgi:fructose/tagatose bisphosphate aldolase